MNEFDHLRAMEVLASLNLNSAQIYSVCGKTDHERAMNILSTLEKSDISEDRKVTKK